jgi:hypothetical protein
MAEASRRTGSAGISTAMSQSVSTGECLALRHFFSLASVAAVVLRSPQLSGQHFS